MRGWKGQDVSITVTPLQGCHSQAKSAGFLWPPWR